MIVTLSGNRYPERERRLLSHEVEPATRLLSTLNITACAYYWTVTVHNRTVLTL
jgi:hypothetical protein